MPQVVSMFEHIHSKKQNKVLVQRLNDLVYVHYNLRLRHRQILGTDLSPITLEEVDPQSDWITEVEDPIFTDEDLDWVDQADREAEAIAMAEEEDRARGDTLDAGLGASESDTETQAEMMAATSSRTSLRRLRKRTKV